MKRRRVLKGREEESQVNRKSRRSGDLKPEEDGIEGEI
jgi:hypothetical protein